MVTVIIIAEGHKIHTTIDDTYFLGDAQVVQGSDFHIKHISFISQLALSYIFLGASAITIISSLIFIILRIVRRSRHPDCKQKEYVCLMCDYVIGWTDGCQLCMDSLAVQKCAAFKIR